MPFRQKPVGRQIIVITGASSGIGLITARQAARAGAAIVLVSRDRLVLDRLAAEIEADGGRALAVAADVASPVQIDAVVTAAVAQFGRIDTWVNNAGVATYSTLVELPLEEHRRIFETNYWGVVHGSVAAIRHFRSRPGSATLITVGSLNSDVAIPLLSAYSASKHAVKGYTDALRRELLASDPDIAVTLVKPAGIATALPQHAKNHLDREPRIAPPLYAPEIVADAILFAAAHPRREIVVGAVGPLLAGPLALVPRLVDRALALGLPPLSKSSHPMTPTDNLDTPTGGAEIYYKYAPGLPVSLVTQAQKRPAVAAVSLLVFGLIARALLQIGARRTRRR